MFYQGCKTTAACYLIQLATRALITFLANRDGLTEPELVELAVNEYLANNP